MSTIRVRRGKDGFFFNFKPLFSGLWLLHQNVKVVRKMYIQKRKKMCIIHSKRNDYNVL